MVSVRCALVSLSPADYLFEDEPLVNQFISVPKDQSKQVT